MNKIYNRFLFIVFLILVVLFFYFGSGIVMDSGMIKENGWMGSHRWGSFPALFTLVLIVLVGWMLFKKKIK